MAEMRILSAKWTNTLRRFHQEEFGQDLVEYAFVAFLIGLGATAGMGVVASGIADVFRRCAVKIASQI
jgi:Flp pilus assembly pilin Flp